jgi:hypothetical protein
VLEDDPNSVELVAINALDKAVEVASRLCDVIEDALAEIEAPAQVTEQPAAPVEEDIDNLF